jgi:hypothetical protein
MSTRRLAFDDAVCQVACVNAATISSDADTLDKFQLWARETVGQWSRICQNFLDRQRREILEGHPSPAELEAHRTALKWLLRTTRVIHATSVDPDYPDKSMASEIQGRLIQLEESWRLTQERAMPDVEADELLNRHFPDER